MAPVGERAALGLPTLCIAISNNQQANGELMAAAGAFYVFMGPCEQVDVEQLRNAIILSSTIFICVKAWPSVRGSWLMGAVRCG